MRVENASQDKFDIIIVAGQSNASGCGMGETLIPYEKYIELVKGV